MTTHPQTHRGELLVSLGLIALGVYMLVEIQNLGRAQGYEQLGPRLFPYLIAAGLVIFGAVLSYHALSGGWRHMPAEQEALEAHAQPDWVALATISAGLILHMAFIGSIGFVLASTLLFVVVARGFGNKQWLRNVAIGAVLSVATYSLFKLGLRLYLPASPLGVI